MSKKVLVEDSVVMDHAAEVVEEGTGVTYQAEEVDSTLGDGGRLEDSRLEDSYEETGIVPFPMATPEPNLAMVTPSISLAMVTPAVNRKVRFNSGHNETHALTPQNQGQEEEEERTPFPGEGNGSNQTLEANGSNQSFAALKTSFAFLATPQAGRTGTPHAARVSGSQFKIHPALEILSNFGCNFSFGSRQPFEGRGNPSGFETIRRQSKGRVGEAVC